MIGLIRYGDCRLLAAHKKFTAFHRGNYNTGRVRVQCIHIIYPLTDVYSRMFFIIPFIILKFIEETE